MTEAVVTILDFAAQHATTPKPRVAPKGTSARKGSVAVEAAICFPVLLILMLGMWEVGRMIQVQQILLNAARSGARVAAGGVQNNKPVTVAVVQQTVRDYMTSAGIPSAAVSGAQITLTNQSTNTWTDPSDAKPLDPFQLSLLIPSGAAFNSLRWALLQSITGVSQYSVSVNWVSLNDSQISVDSQLPY